MLCVPAHPCNQQFGAASALEGHPGETETERLVSLSREGRGRETAAADFLEGGRGGGGKKVSERNRQR